MNDNPYKAPESNLEISVEESNRQFYVVSIKKFTILFFITLGIYTIYWFYLNWKEFKFYSGRSIWPVPRAIFAIFFTHSLFSEVQEILAGKNKQFKWSPGYLATAYVILSIISSILDRLSSQQIGSPVSGLLSVLILPLLYMPLMKAQKAINYSQDDPEGRNNDMLTAANYVWIVLGILFWSAAIFGFMVMFGLVQLPIH